MIGIVEIYKDYGSDNQELIHKEENLIVDGAGEAIVDLLMTPSSIASAVSGMNDTSNYTVQAISFGKAASAYTQYGHYWRPNGYTATSSLISRVTDDGIIRVMNNTTTPYFGKLGPSSFMDPSGDRKMNSYPSPTDTVIEVGTDTAIDLSGGEFHYNSVGHLVPGKYEAVGHNLNVLQFDTAGSSVFRGCWPVSGTGSKYAIVSSLTYDFVNDVNGSGAQIYPNVQDSLAGTSAGAFGDTPAPGGYNNAGAMDMSGFVRAYHLCRGELGGIVAGGNVHPGMGSGLLVSAEEGNATSAAFAMGNDEDTGVVGKPNPIDNCEVIYVTKIASGDLGYSNLFGGITTLGLWTIDLEKTLAGLSATSHTESDNLLYYSLSGDPYGFGNNLGPGNYPYGWRLSGVAASAAPVSGNQRDPYGGHTWQTLANSAAGDCVGACIHGSSAIGRVHIVPPLTEAADYTFSVYAQGYSVVTENNVGIHMLAELEQGPTPNISYGLQTSGAFPAWGQRGTLTSITNAIDQGPDDDDLFNKWTRMTHTATMPSGTSSIQCNIVLSSVGWGDDEAGDFYDKDRSVAISHAKLEKKSAATEFVAGRVENPPFRFKNENNPLRYKLFAKRTLTNTLTAIKDKSITDAGSAEYQDLTIVWRIKFS